MKRTDGILLAMGAVLSLLLLTSACAWGDSARPGTDPGSADADAEASADGVRVTLSPEENRTVPSSSSDLLREPASEAAEASLRALYGRMEAENAACGIAFLGYTDPNVSIPMNIEGYGILENSDTAAEYPFLLEMTPADCASGCFSELYCVVPSEQAASILVEQTAMDEGAEPTEKAEAALYESSACGPVFVCADSNGWDGSNVLVTVRLQDGRELRFHPFLYANLGTVGVPEGVCDFTVYSNANPYYYGPAE